MVNGTCFARFSIGSGGILRAALRAHDLFGKGGGTRHAALDVLNAKLLRPPRQQFVELRLGRTDDLVL
jgi:hypothetical protein